MEKSFEEALDDLINSWLKAGGKIDAVLSALELKVMALKEEGDPDEVD